MLAMKDVNYSQIKISTISITVINTQRNMQLKRTNREGSTRLMEILV